MTTKREKEAARRRIISAISNIAEPRHAYEIFRKLKSELAKFVSKDTFYRIIDDELRAGNMASFGIGRGRKIWRDNRKDSSVGLVKLEGDARRRLDKFLRRMNAYVDPSKTYGEDQGWGPILLTNAPLERMGTRFQRDSPNTVGLMVEFADFSIEMDEWMDQCYQDYLRDQLFAREEVEALSDYEEQRAKLGSEYWELESRSLTFDKDRPDYNPYLRRLSKAQLIRKTGKLPLTRRERRRLRELRRGEALSDRLEEYFQMQHPIFGVLLLDEENEQMMDYIKPFKERLAEDIAKFREILRSVHRKTLCRYRVYYSNLFEAASKRKGLVLFQTPARTRQYCKMFLAAVEEEIERRDAEGSRNSRMVLKRLQ